MKRQRRGWVKCQTLTQDWTQGRREGGRSQAFVQSNGNSAGRQAVLQPKLALRRVCVSQAGSCHGSPASSVIAWQQRVVGGAPHWAARPGAEFQGQRLRTLVTYTPSSWRSINCVLMATHQQWRRGQKSQVVLSRVKQGTGQPGWLWKQEQTPVSLQIRLSIAMWHWARNLMS